LRSFIQHIAQATAIVAIVFALALRAYGQGSDYSPVLLNSPLPYRVELRQYSMGQVDIPTLHSYAVGELGAGKFLFISGRTNGLHGFDCCTFPEGNFPPESQNRDVWVIDFPNKQTWRRSLNEGGLTEQQILSLSPTNNQFYTKNDRLYITGGYGKTGETATGSPTFGTFDMLTAIDLPGLSNWVMGGPGTAAQHIRQIQSPAVKVTGGAMYEMGGRTHLVFGQDFNGIYSPFVNGFYTRQVRSFTINDDGVNLSIENVQSTAPNGNFRRRDLNVFPVLRPDGMGGLEQGLTVLAGVFTSAGDAWSVPVEIDAQGNPTMANPADPNTFNQSMNVYHSAKLGFYSESREEMHELLFGGITLDYLDPSTQTIERDGNLPFVNDIAAIVVDENGNYSQHHLGFFPQIMNGDNVLRFGANAEFLMAEGIPTFENGVIDFDALQGKVTLGHIFGGIAANAPHTRSNPSALSAGSNYVFEVVIFVVPEPSALVLLAISGLLFTAARCRVRA
jgi:hypothetical protein